MEHQIETHQANIDRIRTQMIPVTSDPHLKAYFKETVATMEGHMKQAEEIQKQLS